MNHWNHLKHHHHLNVGYIRGPSDAAGLVDDTKHALNPTDALEATGTVPTYIGLGLALGGLVGSIVAKKHVFLASAAGGIGGYLYGSKIVAKVSGK